MHTTLKINNQAWRIDESTGFLRAKAVVIEDAVMPYNRHEVGEVPGDIHGDILYIHAPKDQFSQQNAIDSLNGALLTIGHEWQTINNENSIGHISGTPVLEGEQLIADVLITSPEAITRIQLPEDNPERLVELSSSYESDIHWGAGRTILNRDFHGIQTNFKFNHVALLPKGSGRGGSSVRISNENQEKTEMDFTRVKLANGSVIHVANQDVDTLEKSETEAKEKTDNAVDPSKLQEAMTELESINNQMSELQKQKGELEGQLVAAKEQLDAALSPAAVEEAAVQIANEKAQAQKIFNSIKGDVKTLEGMHGDKLKTTVVKAHRLANSLPELTEDQLKDSAFIGGLYQAYADSITDKTVVSGAQAVQVNNSAQNQDAPQIKRKYAGDK